jgi:uroporphyrinogen III methyltransferase/synthase
LPDPCSGLLAGRRILVTRPEGQNSTLAEQIRRQGGEAMCLPVIKLIRPSEEGASIGLQTAFGQLGIYAWIFFTSVNAVDFFFKELADEGMGKLACASAKLAAVGPKTAEALLARGLAADLTPERYQAEDLLAAVAPLITPGQHVLLPRSGKARSVLPDGLRALGASVTEVDLYEPRPAEENAGELARLLAAGPLDAVTFTSSSTVTSLLHLADLAGGNSLPLILATPAVAIGPVTAQTARDAGFPVVFTAAEATVEALAATLVSLLSSPGIR